MAPCSTLSLSLPTVVHYNTFHHSHIHSCSYAFWSLLTAPSGCYTPAAVPSWHVKCLCTFISCVKDCSFFTNTSLSISLKFYNNSSEPVKVKCTLVQALRLCTGCTAHRGSRGIALFFHDHGTRRWWGVRATPRPLFTPGKDPVPIVQTAWWAPGPVWTGAENLAPTGIRSPDHPARSQLLYQMSYRAHLWTYDLNY
jgi:hypothetical protein